MSARAALSSTRRRPVIGLLAVVVALLGQWFRHTAFPLAQGLFGDYYEFGLFALGAIGVMLVWRGLDEQEIPATWKGYLGGLFIWVGWFEAGFHFFADVFDIPAFVATPRLVSSPDLNLVQASFPIFIALFILYGLFNRQTKCNLMRWLHRRLRFSPGTPTPGNQRSFARLTAMETIFVIWFCYAFWLFVTYFGASIRIILTVYLLWAAWFIYIFVRLLKISRPGHALRYGIPVGIIGWVLIATPAHMGLFPVIWLEPFEYPMAQFVALAIFVAAMLVFAGSPGRAADGS